MHLFNVATLFVVLTLVGVEFSVSAFVNPSAWRLEAAPQATMLGRFAAVLGKFMPFWYAGALLLLGIETWLHRHTPESRILLTASVIWFLTTFATIFFLVPLNKRVIEAGPGWQEAHRAWDRRHRARVLALATAAILLTYAVAS